jgi:flagellar biosynthesis chaperone FliJ
MRRITAAVAAIIVGVSGIAAAQSGFERSVPVSVIEQSDLALSSPTNVEDLLQRLPQVTAYRYADDVRGVPTLGRDAAPFAQPDFIGAGVFDPGDVGFGNTIEVIRGESSVAAIGPTGALADTSMVLFFAGRDPGPDGALDEFDIGPGLQAQVDLVIGFDGLPGWQAIDAFPGDTWQGGSLILSAQLMPGEPPVLDLINANDGFESVPFSGFFAAGPDWMIAGVDVDTLVANGGPGEMRWAFGSHVHDGSYGACETCLSVINAYPPVPRTVNDLMVFPAPITLMMPEATTTTTMATTTTLALTTTTSPPPATTITSPGDDPATVDGGTGGSFPWIPIGIGFAGIGGALLIFTKKDDEEEESPDNDCDPLLRKWKDLTRQRETAEEFLGSAYENFQARQLFLMELEATRDEYIQAQSGPRGGIGGLDMVRLDGQLIQYDGLQELIDKLAEPIADAQREVERANEDVERRLETYNAALEAEEAARAAYEACIQAATAPPPAPPEEPQPPDDGGTGTPPAAPPTPPAVYTPPVSSEPRKNTRCDAKGQPAPVAVPIGPAVKFKLYTDFDVIVTVDEASKHGSHEHGKAMSTGLKNAGLTLGTIGNLLSGASAGKSAAASVSSFQTGKLVKGSLEGVKGTVSGLDGAGVIPNVPTSLPEAIANGLAATANLGAFIVDKITAWMDENVTVYMRPAYFYQDVSIQPTQIWECRGEMWECVTRVNVYTVGNLKKDSAKDRGPYTRKGDREKYKTKREISRLTARGRGKIIQSAKALAAWEKANSPGDCK